MKKLSRKAFKPLDQEEKDLMESIEHEEWQSVKNIKIEKKEGNRRSPKYLEKRQAYKSSSYSKRLSPNSNKGYRRRDSISNTYFQYSA